MIGAPAALATTILGTNGNDSLSGTSSADVIWAYAGNDYAQGNGGGDQIHMGGWCRPSAWE
ncbi:MAG: hypothetical protein ACXWEG_08980 [Actinomycetota bacterium]